MSSNKKQQSQLQQHHQLGSTALALAKLTENIQSKRNQLNKLYDDINRKSPVKTNLITQVHFDDTLTDEDNERTNAKPATKPQKENLNQTITKRTQDNKTTINLKTKSPSKSTLIKKQSVTVVAPNVTKVKINTKVFKSNTRINELRLKVITRKFAYLWLRKHLYSLKRTKQLLLPSQLK